jgi:hypothetical protein
MDLDRHRSPIEADLDIAINSAADLGLVWQIRTHGAAHWQHCLIRAWMAQYHPPFVITTSRFPPTVKHLYRMHLLLGDCFIK